MVAVRSLPKHGSVHLLNHVVGELHVCKDGQLQCSAPVRRIRTNLISQLNEPGKLDSGAVLYQADDFEVHGGRLSVLLIEASDHSVHKRSDVVLTGFVATTTTTSPPSVVSTFISRGLENLGS